MAKFRWEKYPDNVLTMLWHKDHLWISVSEEKAMDSYNENFECTIRLPAEAVASLRAFLKL
jgi:hypothetical protein